jgi:hypothetical protein
MAGLRKAERKMKGNELTPAELLAFGILPPEPDKPKPGKSHALETLDKTVAVSSCKGEGVSKS